MGTLPAKYEALGVSGDIVTFVTMSPKFGGSVLIARETNVTMSTDTKDSRIGRDEIWAITRPTVPNARLPIPMTIATSSGSAIPPVPAPPR